MEDERDHHPNTDRRDGLSEDLRLVLGWLVLAFCWFSFPGTLRTVLGLVTVGHWYAVLAPVCALVFHVGLLRPAPPQPARSPGAARRSWALLPLVALGIIAIPTLDLQARLLMQRSTGDGPVVAYLIAGTLLVVALSFQTGRLTTRHALDIAAQGADSGRQPFDPLLVVRQGAACFFLVCFMWTWVDLVSPSLLSLGGSEIGETTPTTLVTIAFLFLMVVSVVGVHRHAHPDKLRPACG
ncbi:MAG: hypothetical protein AAF533_00925 [Acidobacteriota bacterium]